MPAFVIRYDGSVYAYCNSCAHIPVELDWMEGEFFDQAGLYLVCATHGATYEPDTGHCIMGPCKGERLCPVPVVERDRMAEGGCGGPGDPDRLGGDPVEVQVGGHDRLALQRCADHRLRDDFRAGMKRLAALGLSLDAWGFHPQLPDITDLARAFVASPRVHLLLPPLHLFTRSPLFDRDWSFVGRPGYHESSGVYYDGRGKPLTEALRCVMHIAEHLTPKDMLSLVVYDDEVDVMVPLGHVSSLTPIQTAVDLIHSGGSTDLFAGWQRGAEELEGGNDASISRVVLLSDGQANQGETRISRIERHCKSWLE